MTPKQEELLNNQVIMLSDLLIKVASLEKVLLSKGFISSDEIAAETKKVIAQLTEAMQKNLPKE